MFYATLTAALDDIAKRSFYEGVTVTPALSHCGDEEAYPSDSDGLEWFCPSCRRVSLPCSLTEGYATTDDADPRSGDDLEDYGDGIEWPSNALDHSREHDLAEFYDEARHIMSNLHTAIETLRERGAVSFHYYVVSTACEITDPDYAEYHEVGLCDECEGYGSSITGWALVAYAA